MDKNFVAKNFTEQQLEEGKMLYTTNCSKCHKLFDTKDFTVDAWNEVVTSMLPKTSLSEEEGVKVRAYVIANAK